RRPPPGRIVNRLQNVLQPFGEALRHNTYSVVMDRVGTFEQLLLLALVRLGDDTYGVPIRDELEARTGRVVSPGAIYTALDRPERHLQGAGRAGAPRSRAVAARRPHAGAGRQAEAVLPHDRTRPRGAAPDAGRARTHGARAQAETGDAVSRESPPLARLLLRI